MSHMDFSSWPREQEGAFVVYEQRNAESQKTAWIAGIALGLVVLLGVIGIYKGVDPEVKDYSKGMNMSNLTKKRPTAAPAATPAPAPAAAPAPATTPSAETPAAPATENK